MKITELITKCAAVFAAELTKKLQDAPAHILLIFDGWTSAIMQTYLAAELLTFNELAGSHSGENTVEVLYDILNKTKIKETSLSSFCNYYTYSNRFLMLHQIMLLLIKRACIYWIRGL
ncbi:hypothetical protein Hypma_004006 [Hypsizygus marmoreus]|uniref:Uncharacterized protein n=1 Tax=Hypsizygus marmoreus TaxID=39966 RepID=A0A369J9U9_HYPMA|nr:hypothetical protein Hypma_004856 [Hypsizygus marmoreus]RDB15636.1 hypothetical protein Hypma_004006 [Hypsizygus marmoreus]